MCHIGLQYIIMNTVTHHILRGITQFSEFQRNAGDAVTTVVKMTRVISIGDKLNQLLNTHYRDLPKGRHTYKLSPRNENVIFWNESPNQ